MPNKDGTGPKGEGCGTGGQKGRLAGNSAKPNLSKRFGLFSRKKRGKGMGEGPRDGRGQGKQLGRRKEGHNA